MKDGAMQPDGDRRRADDTRFSAIDEKIADLKREMTANTEVTTQVRDILTSFAVLAKVAKWCTALGAFGLMVYTFWQKLTGR